MEKLLIHIKECIEIIKIVQIKVLLKKVINDFNNLKKEYKIIDNLLKDSERISKKLSFSLRGNDLLINKFLKKT